MIIFGGRGWKSGRMERWNNVRMEEWKDGKTRVEGLVIWFKGVVNFRK